MTERDGILDEPSHLELVVDRDAPDERRVVITDDFGHHVEMSVDQLRVLVEGLQFGVLELVDPTGAAVQPS
ncbi:MAG TPA: hypothetical protein VJX10_16110 [Pseudonocardiaceae bacterium]|nr:hypothetical protein [Pseudonocardiaceae bacterium]